MPDRNCDGCVACCDGLLPGEVNGHEFYLGKPCFYNTGSSCSIYDSKPPMCVNFKCEWVSNPNIPEELDPRQSNMLLRSNRGESIGAFVDSFDNPYIERLDQLSIDLGIPIQVSCGNLHVKTIGEL